MSVCFHAAGFYWKNFQRHPAASAALKSSCYSHVPRSQMKTTLLPNEVHEEVLVYSSSFAASRLHCHYRPFRRDFQLDQSSAYSKATSL